jgi:hypothetical protein
MAIVQISKIQLRRGKEKIDGMPQLASGEMAWAVDTQQLYIGNGSVVEGAPAVGNTKILTGADLAGERNILTIAQYGYKKDPRLPLRPLQDRLDDRVNFSSFNDTRPSKNSSMAKNIQTAIDILYKDTENTNNAPERKAILEFGPGLYEFDNPIRIYSFTNIVGAGLGRTIFKYTGSGSAFQLVNSQVTATSDPKNVVNNTTSNQCKFVNLSDFTLIIDNSKNNSNSKTTAFLLNSLRNSKFLNLRIQSDWGPNIQNNDYTDSIAFDMLSTTELICCSNNIFDNISISNFRIGINARGDINSNIILNSSFSDMEVGVNFGQFADLSSYGQLYGPRNNTISNSTFQSIKKQGIKIYYGTGNLSSQNKFTSVGNNNGSNVNAAFGVVEFDSPSNLISNNSSERHTALSNNEMFAKDNGQADLPPYIGEVNARANYVNPFTNVRLIEYTTTPTQILRLPLVQTCHLEVEYLYQSTNQSINRHRIRRGKLSILADTAYLDVNSIPKIEFVDEYEYHGVGSESNYTDEDTHVIFTARVKKYANSKSDIRIYYQFQNSQSQNEQATLTYTYKILS